MSNPHIPDERARARDLLQQIDHWSGNWTSDGSAWIQWRSEVVNLIRRVYGGNSQLEKDFASAIYYRSLASMALHGTSGSNTPSTKEPHA